MLEGYKAHTAVGGIHVLNVFVDKPFLPVPPDWEEEDAFWSSGELLSCYAVICMDSVLASGLKSSGRVSFRKHLAFIQVCPNLSWVKYFTL